MGIRKSQGKNKKSGKPTAAIAAKREEAVRRSGQAARGKRARAS